VVRNGENGFLVPIKDAQALASSISILVQSPELRRQMGVEGRRRAVREFSEEQITRQILRIYVELVKGKWHLADRPHSEQQQEVLAEA
jgi:glycosyltransferase involved in cell wall biosynthesis